MRSLHLFAAALVLLLLISPAQPSFAGISRSQTDVIALTGDREGTSVSVTGRIRTTQGRPIKGAFIVIKDASTNEVVRSTYSSSFGYYKLEPIESGRMYVLTITHRRYLFAFPAQLLEINEDRTGVDFMGEPNN